MVIRKNKCLTLHVPMEDLPDPDTHRCPDNNAKVDISSCAFSEDVGAAELKTFWSDPTFKVESTIFLLCKSAGKSYLPMEHMGCC
jgi:hypothetical protein